MAAKDFAVGAPTVPTTTSPVASPIRTVRSGTFRRSPRSWGSSGRRAITASRWANAARQADAAWVFPEGVLDPLVAAQLPRHAVEGFRELSDLVLARHGEPDRQVSGLDGLDSFDDSPEGLDQPPRAHCAQAEAEHHRER